MKHIHIISLVGLLTAGNAPLAMASSTAHHHMPASTTVASANPMDMMSEGEVRKVDKSAQRITLKHGEIRNLDMPPMTMVFRVKDAALLDKVKTGDKVVFTAEEIKGALTLVSIKPVNN